MIQWELDQEHGNSIPLALEENTVSTDLREFALTLQGRASEGQDNSREPQLPVSYNESTHAFDSNVSQNDLFSEE